MTELSSHFTSETDIVYRVIVFLKELLKLRDIIVLVEITIIGGLLRGTLVRWRKSIEEWTIGTRRNVKEQETRTRVSNCFATLHDVMLNDEAGC